MCLPTHPSFATIHLTHTHARTRTCTRIRASYSHAKGISITMSLNMQPQRSLTRSQTSFRRFGWNRLPAEIRYMVWNELIRSPSSPSMPAEDKADTLVNPAKVNFTNYSLVSKQWQPIFERELFRRLTLHQECINSLSVLSLSRKYLVEHIWLRIELATYSCPACWRQPTYEESTRDGVIVGEALQNLFRILSSWGPSIDPTFGGLALELSAHSPSDSQHCFYGVHVQTLTRPGQLRNTPVRGRQARHVGTYSDVLGRSWTPPPDRELTERGEYQRLHDELHVDFKKGLRSVTAVKSLTVRRHNQRRISLASLRYMMNRLVRLENVRLEFWQKIMSPSLDASVRAGIVLNTGKPPSLFSPITPCYPGKDASNL